MKLLKYNSYLLLFVFFFLTNPKILYSWDLGFKSGTTFQSFYLNGKNNAHEHSAFGIDTGIFGSFLVHPRILLLADIGFSYHYQSFYTSYIGLTTAFVIYPEYFPFIGLSVKEHYYSQIFSKKHQWATNLYITAGSKLFYTDHHSIWMFFEFLLFQSLYQKINSSRFSLNLAYSYQL